MLHRAEGVGDPVVAAVADQQDVHLAQLGVAVRAARNAGVDLGRLGQRPGVPMGAVDRPGHDVLEATERRGALAGRFVGAETVVRVDRGAAP